MAGKKNTSLDRVLGRLDSLDPANLANLVQRLVRERTQLENVFNILQEGVLVIDGDGVIDYANSAAHRLIGLTADDLSGKILWRLVPGLRPSLQSSLVDDAPALPVVTREIELTYPEARTVRLYMVPFSGEAHGSERRFAIILTDITRD
ncbi:MAG TPA: PAS domain-containing protein, partial [Rariglobus sp.]